MVTNAQQKALHSVAFHCQKRRLCAFIFVASAGLLPGTFSQAVALHAKTVTHYSGSALLTCFTACDAGDYTGPFPCTSNVFDGETNIVYDSDWLIGSNDEVVW